MLRQFQSWPWLLAGLWLALYLALALAASAGWRAKPVALLGKPYLRRCQVEETGGYRCATATAKLKAINSALRLKAHHDYFILLTAQLFSDSPVKVYADFYGGKDYDAPAQKGFILLRPGPAQSFVLRWPSNLPPEHAWFRISNADATEFAIESIQIRCSSTGVTRARDIALVFFALFLLRAVWRDRVALSRLRWLRPVTDFTKLGSWRDVALLAGGIAVLLLLRASTLGAPMVFGDEMSYALLSATLGDATLYSHNHLLLPMPNRLFFEVYYLATLSGDGMLSCARAINAVLFALAAFPLFALSRMFLPRWQAFALTAVVLLLPNNAYTCFFMPESFYFLGFYTVAWAFVAFTRPGGRMRYATFAGIALAMLSLIKPHGLTVLLACNLTLLIGVCAWRHERRRIALGWIVLLFSFTVAHSLIGISTASTTSENWLENLFGLGLYANILTHTLHVSLGAEALARLRLAMIDNVGSLFLLFGVPILISLGWIARPRAASDSAPAGLGRLHLFAFITLVCLLIGTIKFTAYIAGSDVNQMPDAIHQRYYDFTFGLLLLGAAASLQTLCAFDRRRRLRMALLLGPVGGTAIWYLTHEFMHLRPAWVQHPTLVSVWAEAIDWLPWLALVLILALLLAPRWTRLAARIYAACILWVCLSGYLTIWDYAAGSQIPADEDRTVRVVQSLYTRARLEHGLVVGSAFEPLFRTAFQLRNNATIELLSPGSTVDVGKTARDAQWVLTYGNYNLGADWQPRLRLPGAATLYEKPAAD